MKAEEFYKKRSNSIRELLALSPKQIEYIALIMEEYAALRQPPVMQRSELLAFKKFISTTPQTELEYYSDEEFTDLYLMFCG